MRLKIYSIALTAVLLCPLASCNQRKAASPKAEEQEKLFEMVSEASANGDYSRALRLADSVLSLELPDTFRAYIMDEKCVALYNSGNTEYGAKYVDTLLDFGREHKINHSIIQGLSIKGIDLRQNNKYEEAIPIYIEGLNIAREEGDVEMEQYLTDLLTIVYVELGRFKEALTTAENSVKLAKQLGDTATIISAISSKSNIYLKTDVNKVVATLEPWREAANQSSPLIQMKYYTPLISAYLRVGRFQECHEIISRLDSLTADIPETHIVRHNILLQKSQLARYEKRYEDELKYYHELDKMPYFGKDESVHMTDRALCNANLGNWKEAYEYEKMAFSALDSVRESETDRQLSEFAVKYKTMQRQIEIERLKRSRLAWVLISASAALLLIIVVGILIYVRRRARLRLERTKQEEYIRGLEEERNLVARELHDDIAGYITGLQLELGIIPEEQTRKRLNEIGNRVRNLSHNMMSPEFEETNLPALLVHYSAGISHRHSDTTVLAVDNSNFDFDSLSEQQNRELFRIIQENVANAFKHANPTKLQISLFGEGDSYRITIVNDGADSSRAERSEGIGRRTIAARAALIGASVEYTCSEGIFTTTITGKI